MAIEFNEKRGYQRVQQMLPVSGQCLEPAGDIHPFHGQSQDVSLRGLCIKVGHTNGFKVGQSIELSIKFILDEPPIEAFGSVRWTDVSRDSDWPVNMGVELTGMGGAHHYDRWLEMLSWR